MAKHRTHSIEFKRQVAQEFLAGETLHGLGLRPEKWSSVKYGFRADGGHWNGEEETHGGGDRREASAS
jgi:hypothetical protein